MSSRKIQNLSRENRKVVRSRTCLKLLNCQACGAPHLWRSIYPTTHEARQQSRRELRNIVNGGFKHRSYLSQKTFARKEFDEVRKNFRGMYKSKTTRKNTGDSPTLIFPLLWMANCSSSLCRFSDWDRHPSGRMVNGNERNSILTFKPIRYEKPCYQTTSGLRKLSVQTVFKLRRLQNLTGPPKQPQWRIPITGHQVLVKTWDRLLLLAESFIRCVRQKLLINNQHVPEVPTKAAALCRTI